MESRFKRPRLAQAAIYELRFDPEWQQIVQYRTKSWFRWGWCRLDEIVELVNKHYGTRWTREELLRRFAIPCGQGEVKFGQDGKQRAFDLHLLWIGDSSDLHCRPHTRTDLLFLQWNDRSVFAPAGWTKDVFWALSGGCTKAILRNGEKIACLEDGTPVFAMTGAGKCY